MSATLYQEILEKQLAARKSILPQIEVFEPDWLTGDVHREICGRLDGILEEVAIGAKDPANCAGGPRDLFETPPGLGKTLMCGVHLIANGLGRHPDWQFIYITHGFDKAADVGVDTRRRINDPRFKEIHPRLEIDKSANAKDFFTTTLGGKVTFTGVEGDALGKRAHVLIVDDPFKNEQEARSETHQEKVLKFVLSVAESRLHPYGAIVVIHQRWHPDDLIGRLKKLTARPYKIHKYPMEATEDCSWRKKGDSVHKARFSNEWVRLTKQTKLEAGQEWIWHAMYQQEPVLDTGMLFKREWFDNHLIPREKFPKNVRWYVSTDFATKEGSGDFSVSRPFCIDEFDNIYFDDPFCKQVTPNVAAKATFDILESRNATGIFVEKGPLWNAIQGDYRREQYERRVYPEIHEFQRVTNKGESAAGLISHMAAGKVYHVDSMFTRDVVIPQYMAFTGERGVKEVDDIVDADMLPFLSWKKIRRPFKDVELPEIDATPQLNREILAVIAGEGKSDKFAWTAGEEEGDDESVLFGD